ncbi:MAG TPA: hypothetical protein V6C78_33855 [Crinalium sp.]
MMANRRTVLNIKRSLRLCSSSYNAQPPIGFVRPTGAQKESVSQENVQWFSKRAIAC